MAVSIYLAKVGTLQTAIANFVENATSTSHVATIPIQAGATILDIRVQGYIAWGAASASLDIGDTADPNGYIAGEDMVAWGSEVQSYSVLGGDLTQGAYFNTGTQVGPASGNFGFNYIVGSNIIATMTVGTPAVTTGRTSVVVYYSVPASVPIVSA